MPGELIFQLNQAGEPTGVSISDSILEVGLRASQTNPVLRAACK